MQCGIIEAGLHKQHEGKNEEGEKYNAPPVISFFFFFDRHGMQHARE